MHDKNGKSRFFTHKYANSSKMERGKTQDDDGYLTGSLSQPICIISKLFHSMHPMLPYYIF